MRRYYNAPVSLLTVGARENNMTQNAEEKGLLFRLLPSRLGEHDDGAGAAFEGSFDCTDSDGLCGVTGQMGGAAELLEHLPVEHGCLGLTGNLNTRKGK